MTELTPIAELQARVETESIARPAVLDQLAEDNQKNIVRNNMLVTGYEWSDEIAITEQARLKAEKQEQAREYIQSIAPTIDESGKNDVTVKCIGIPDEFVEHGTQSILRAKYGLDAAGIARQVQEILSGSVAGLKLKAK